MLSPFSDLALSKRLERTEGFACAQFAEGRNRLIPDAGSSWIEHAGTYAIFNGIDSPVTQSFGLGLFEPLTPESLDTIERFFLDRGAPVVHEVSPFAGIQTLDLLCDRGYRPIELTNVLCRSIDSPPPEPQTGGVRARVIEPEEGRLWAEISAEGWSHEHPEFLDFLLENGAVMTASPQSLGFIAELDGQPGAAAVLWIHQGVAMLGGSATIPQLRRRGLHSALQRERLRYALDHGCDLAMMSAEPGSESQRNAERNGFRITYTRTKWQRHKWLRPSNDAK